jgi:hypothetical protein
MDFEVTRALLLLLFMLLVLNLFLLNDGKQKTLFESFDSYEFLRNCLKSASLLAAKENVPLSVSSYVSKRPSLRNFNLKNSVKLDSFFDYLKI